jgi:hypothetical protein
MAASSGEGDDVTVSNLPRSIVLIMTQNHDGVVTPSDGPKAQSFLAAMRGELCRL